VGAYGRKDRAIIKGVLKRGGMTKGGGKKVGVDEVGY